MSRILLAALLAALSTITSAAGPTETLAWVAPTQNTDQTVITLPLTYNIYQSQGAACPSGPTPGPVPATTPVQTGISALTFQLTSGLADGATFCWSITAVAGGVESAKTNAVSDTFPPATPNPPGSVTNKHP